MRQSRIQLRIIIYKIAMFLQGLMLKHIYKAKYIGLFSSKLNHISKMSLKDLLEIESDNKPTPKAFQKYPLLRLIPIVYSICLISPVCHADMRNKLQGMFQSMGFASHVTSGGAYNDQKGGYITGGSLFARAPVEDHRLMNFQAPSFGWGCGGVDLFTGSISFISKEDLVNTLRAIGSNAMSYAYGLALQQVTPQIKAVIDNLQATMQEINNANINSCRMAAQLVGGMAPKTQASTELYCSSKGLKLGRFTDYADAKHECQKTDKRGDVSEADDAEFKDTLGEEFNLVWKAIKGNAFLAGDRETGEFMMSISGSILSKKEGDTPRMKYLPSLTTKPEFIKAIIGAGIAKATPNTKISIYRCDEVDKCLNPFTQQEVLVAKENTLFEKVQKTVLDLYEKVVNDTAPTDEEKGFVNATSIPILRILAINAAYKNDAHPISLSELVEIISYDILLSHISNILDLVVKHVMELKAVQISDDAIREFKKSITRTQAMILEERRTLLHQLQASIAVIERVKRLEEFTYNKFLGAHMKDMHES